MASIVLKSVGAAVGNMIMPGLGGAALGSLATSYGGVIDGQLGLSVHVTGPHLDNLSVQDSRYGAGIPIIYGKARVAGNVIWSTDLVETQHDSNASGKGGGASVTTTTYTYSLSCAVGICAGPIGGIGKIWADTTVIYEDGVWVSGYCDGAAIHLGGSGQGVDSIMEATLGAGQVPAYQGLAYVVFDTLQLADFGNRIPSLTFEVIPATTTQAPERMGAVAPNVSQAHGAALCATMQPLPLGDSGTSFLVGGFKASGSSVVFTVIAYDVSGDTPTELYRVSSAAFTASSPADVAWDRSPDGRYVAFYLLNSGVPTHYFALYDTATKSFGAVTSAALAISSATKKIAWLDDLHLVIDTTVGTVRGLECFVRAGNSLVDLGFTALWGAGSASAMTPFYGAQFTPYAGGLIAYMGGTSTTSLTLNARTVHWRGNGLALGASYTAFSGVALGTGSGMHGCFVKTASDEWTLAYGTVLDYRLVSFSPSATGITVTRPWTVFTPAIGTGTAQAPIFYGDRLLMLQRSSVENYYRLSEVTLGDGVFALSVNTVLVTGGMASATFFNAVRLDSMRLLVMAVGGFSNYILQLAVIERTAPGSLADIVADILSRAGYESGDYDLSALTETAVTGYVLKEPMSARNALEPLQTYQPFDLIESNGVLTAVLRGGAAVAVLDAGSRCAALYGKEQPPALLTLRAQEADLPVEVDLEYIDPSRTYEINCQRARRLAVTSRKVEKVSLPVVCDAATAKQIAEARLYALWAERVFYRFNVGREWAALEPSDVVDLGGGQLARLTSVIQQGGLIRIEAFPSLSVSSSASADNGATLAAGGNDPVPTALYVMDLPLLRDADDQPGLYIAASGRGGWKNATVMKSTDGITYAVAASATSAAKVGTAVSVLAGGQSFYIDRAASITVQMLQGELSSCTESDLMNGANAALLGGEILQFQTATLTGTGLYVLTNLLRGRRGSEGAMTSHVLGEDFVLLEKGTVDFLPLTLTDRGKTLSFRGLSAGQSLSEGRDYTVTPVLNVLKPLPPAQIKGVRSGGDLTISWVRRARRNSEWVDYIDVPLDEDQEVYQVDILNGATVMRSWTGLTSASATYTQAQQVTDFGAAQSSLSVKIYQVSSRYGLGAAATATI